MGIFSKILGDANERYVRSLAPIVEQVNALEPAFEELSADALRAKTDEFKKRLAGGETLDELLPEAFAAVREAAKRSIGERHFDVQLLGGIVLHRGAIAEMRTGEGKTLVATLPLYLNAITGKGCHLVTPNDYLSRVGGGWMGPIYHALGISVGVIAHEFSGIYDPAYQEVPSHGDPRLDHWRPVSRREAYAADVTYGTNNEFGFDYLRDNMAYALTQVAQREHQYAIVDEVDSILIDEARTPLIISAPDEESAGYYQTFARIVPQLKENIDYNVDEKLKAVTITEEGIDKVEKLLGVKDIYESKGFRYVRYLEQALRARALFQADRDYVVKDGQVIIVDEFTGRLMPGRRWSEGLHQAVEAQEGVEVQRESRTLATITFQNYFRLYEKLAGMTGTAATSAEEFHKVYKMDVVMIPTNRPMVRANLPDLVLKNEHGKFLAITREVKERHSRGQPILIGTVSIEKNERLSAYLGREGIPYNILNAKNHEAEAFVIAQAGRPGAVTLATNMAGRGVDIILGGNPPVPDEGEKVRAAGGLHVIGTERHEARRIDNQLRGRSGRQGDPGSSQFFLSLEDDLMRIFGGERIRSMMESFGIPEDQPIEHGMVSKAIESAQSKIEGFHFDARKHILEFDDVVNKQREYVYRLRREILEEAEGEPQKLSQRLSAVVQDEVSRLVDAHTTGHPSEWNIEEISENVRAIAADVPATLHQDFAGIVARASSTEEKREELRNHLLGVFEHLLGERERAMGEAVMANIAKIVMLQSIDFLWMDQLDQMEHLRDSVRLRAYGQRDPLVEYKHEGARLFRELQSAIRSQIINTIFKVGLPAGALAQAGVAAQPTMPRRVEERRPELVLAGVPAGAAPAQVQARPGSPGGNPRSQPKVGRNDPCPCGSGKKYKRCGDLNTDEHQRLMAKK